MTDPRLPKVHLLMRNWTLACRPLARFIHLAASSELSRVTCARCHKRWEETSAVTKAAQGTWPEPVNLPEHDKNA